MNQETKTFIREEMEGLAVLIDKQFQRVDDRFQSVERDLQEVKRVVEDGNEVTLRLEHALHDRVDIIQEEHQTTRHRVEKIENHLGLPHSLSA